MRGFSVSLKRSRRAPRFRSERSALRFSRPRRNAGRYATGALFLPQVSSGSMLFSDFVSVLRKLHRDFAAKKRHGDDGDDRDESDENTIFGERRTVVIMQEPRPRAG